MDQPVGIKADLIPYGAEYASIVRLWIESEETYSDISRGKEFPPPDEIVDSWQRDGVTSYLLFSNSRPVAYGELWARTIDMAVEIAHVVVEPVMRGKGYGNKMLDLLYRRAAARTDVGKVVINVLNENEIALACALTCGFELVSANKHTVGLKLIRMVR